MVDAELCSLNSPQPSGTFWKVLCPNSSSDLLGSAQVFKGKDGPLTLDWSRVRVFDREVGQMFVNLAKMSKEAKVGRS